MPYLKIEVAGNPSFGGYLSIDKGKEERLSDGDIYELSTGVHYLEVYSKSRFERSSGKFLVGLSNVTDDGGYINRSNRRQGYEAMGDAWNFQVRAGENDLVILSIFSDDSEICGTPEYGVYELDEHTRAELDGQFSELHEEQERIANTPRRNPKMIITGGIIAAISVWLLYIGMQADQPMEPQNAAVFVGVAALGALIMLLGMIKRVRR